MDTETQSQKETEMGSQVDRNAQRNCEPPQTQTLRHAETPTEMQRQNHLETHAKKHTEGPRKRQMQREPKTDLSERPQEKHRNTETDRERQRY